MQQFIQNVAFHAYIGFTQKPMYTKKGKRLLSLMTYKAFIKIDVWVNSSCGPDPLDHESNILSQNVAFFSCRPYRPRIKIDTIPKLNSEEQKISS